MDRRTAFKAVAAGVIAGPAALPAATAKVEPVLATDMGKLAYFVLPDGPARSCVFVLQNGMQRIVHGRRGGEPGFFHIRGRLATETEEPLYILNWPNIDPDTQLYRPPNDLSFPSWTWGPVNFWDCEVDENSSLWIRSKLRHLNHSSDPGHVPSQLQELHKRIVEEQRCR